jgi:hypothetical protein
LLNAWWEAQGRESDPTALAGALLKGADPDAVAAMWQGVNAQGYGALDVPAALGHLQAGDWPLRPATRLSPLAATVLGAPVQGQVQTWTSQTITVAPGEPFTAVFEIDEWTSKVKIQVINISAPDNSAYAVMPNALEMHVQSAKRTLFPHPVAHTWYPAFYGSSFQIIIEDGPWTSPWGQEADQPMEPGLMKLSLGGADWNESPVSFRVRITRENYRQPLQNPIFSGTIRRGDTFRVPVDIPAGTATATFDLVWQRNWSQFPASGFGLALYDPERRLVAAEGEGDAPSRIAITAPQAGVWTVLISGFDVEMADYFNLYLTLD